MVAIITNVRKLFEMVEISLLMACSLAETERKRDNVNIVTVKPNIMKRHEARKDLRKLSLVTSILYGNVTFIFCKMWEIMLFTEYGKDYNNIEYTSQTTSHFFNKK